MRTRLHQLYIAVLMLGFLAPAGHASAAAAATESLSSIMERAAAAREASDFEAAIAIYGMALRRNPSLVEAWIGRGEAILYGRNEVGRAMDDFSRACSVAPDRPEGYYWKGVAYARQGDFTRTIGMMTEVIQRDSTWVGAYVYRGFALDRLGNLAQAIDDYTRAIALAPDHAVPYYYRGVAYQNLGRVDRAAADFGRCIERAPSFARAYFQRAGLYADADLWSHAARDYEVVVRLTPSNPDAHYNLAVCYERLGRTAQARVQYATFAAMAPSGDAYAEALAYARARADSYRSSSPAYTSSWSSGPSSRMLEIRADQEARAAAEEAVRRYQYQLSQ